MAVPLYRQVGKGKARRYQKVNLGRGRRPADLAGPYFLRYSLANGTRPWEAVGDDLDSAIDAQECKQAYFEALDANVPVVQDQDEAGRTKITDAVYQWFAELQLFLGKDQRSASVKEMLDPRRRFLRAAKDRKGEATLLFPGQRRPVVRVRRNLGSLARRSRQSAGDLRDSDHLGKCSDPYHSRSDAGHFGSFLDQSATSCVCHSKK